MTIIEGSKFELFPILPYPCTTFLIQTIHFSSKPSSKQHLFQETPIPLCQGLEVIFRLHSPLHSEKSRLFGFRLWVAAATARQPAWPLEVGSWVGGTPARHGTAQIGDVAARVGLASLPLVFHLARLLCTGPEESVSHASFTYRWGPNPELCDG